MAVRLVEKMAGEMVGMKASVTVYVRAVQLGV